MTASSTDLRRDWLLATHDINLLEEPRPWVVNNEEVAELLKRMDQDDKQSDSWYETTLRNLFKQHPEEFELGVRLFELYLTLNKPDYASAVTQQLLQVHGPGLRTVALLLRDPKLETQELEKYLRKDRQITDYKPAKDGAYYADDFVGYEVGIITYLLKNGESFEAKTRLDRLLELGVKDEKLHGVVQLLDGQSKNIFESLNEWNAKAVTVTAKHIHQIDYTANQLVYFHWPELETVFMNSEDQTLPAATVDALLALPRETLVADLLTFMRHVVVNRAQIMEAEEWPTIGVLSAVHLLWHYGEEAAALDALLDILRCDDEYQSFMFGVETSEWLTEPLLLLGVNQPQKLLDFVREPFRETYARLSAMNAIGQIAFHYPERREEVLNYYYELYDFILAPDLPAGVLDANFTSYAFATLTELADHERSLALAKTLFDRDLLDPSLQGDLYETNYLLKHPQRKRLESLPATIKDYFSGEYQEQPALLKSEAEINKLLAEMSSPVERLLMGRRLASIGSAQHRSEVSRPAETTSKTAPTKKVGRNEPCPCGSGRKYKQCCLKKG